MSSNSPAEVREATKVADVSFVVGREVNAAPHASSWRNALALRAGVIACGCAAASLGALLARVCPEQWKSVLWILGLASHWQWLYLTVGSAAAIAWLATGRVRAILPLAILALVWSLHSPSAPNADNGANNSSPASPRLTIASANLNFNNPDLSALRGWLLEPNGPDIVALEEFTDAAQRVVSENEIRERYPYQFFAAAKGPFGLAILSRHPFINTEQVPLRDEWQTPRLRAVIAWNGQSVAVSAVHPMPPLNARYSVARDVALREEAEWLSTFNGHGILAGDLNDTPWSTGMLDVEGKLRRATGLAPTWPNVGGWLSVLPIDHVLVTSGWRRLSASIGPDLGSDHRPVVVGLSIAM
jgi:endonuclease/exonuclease/phosphatase (EEP) superfamily protein YafD